MAYMPVHESDAVTDEMVLKAIKSYGADRPAMLCDLWSMAGIRRDCMWMAVMKESIQRLKKAGKIKYSRKPAGWVAA